VKIRSQLGASQVALVLTMVPITLLSGFTFPIDQMPPAIQGFTLIIHARYYITILRAIFLKGSTLTELMVPVLALLLYATVIAWLAARAFRKRLD
jgi:ABC-2 type transport system permease protein